MTPKIAIAIPTHDMVPALFMYDVAALAAYTVAAMPEDVPFGITMVSGTYVHAARQELADLALADGATHVLWLDSDMRFPRDSLVRLLKHNKPIVGINYAKRGVPSDFVAIKEVGMPGEKLITGEDSTGLEEVEALGFGCVLMKTEVLRYLPDPKITPWFQNEHLGDGRWMGEDVFFCRLLREARVSLLVDHDLSKACAHIGQFEYRCEHAELETKA